MAFLSSGGTSVSSRKFLIRLFQEGYERLCFIWCFSHQLELALKYSLKVFMNHLDDSLRNFYYLNQKPCKKLRVERHVSIIRRSI